MNLKVTIKEIRESIAIMKFEDGTITTWPVDKLPKEAKAEDVLSFSINDNGQVSQDPEKLAKDLLNEILNIE